MMKLNKLVSVLRSRPVQRGTDQPVSEMTYTVSSGTLNPSIPPPPSAFCRLSHAGRTFYQTYNARRPCLSSGFRTCVEQFAVIRHECAVADDVPSRSEDCTFSVVVRSSLGNRNCTIYCNYCLPAATGYQRFCLFFFAIYVIVRCPCNVFDMRVSP